MVVILCEVKSMDQIEPSRIEKVAWSNIPFHSITFNSFSLVSRYTNTNSYIKQNK